MVSLFSLTRAKETAHPLRVDDGQGGDLRGARQEAAYSGLAREGHGRLHELLFEGPSRALLCGRHHRHGHAVLPRLDQFGAKWVFLGLQLASPDPKAHSHHDREHEPDYGCQHDA
eukprot:CAMPEP_0204270916 /NCGR_PEP_ID=MMETSP0468-20130131/19164_1 /ASSEMBLY_ACC=CAM_ASM_000383 /TAXON_ID=2969 /ORGANISM="Oxyrrhis marina" /LENGTH=114 /DNA_ID=CAMNT_0051246507 /DNA_START=409 /DNA_END=753 /DNA_ORIENTATION=-